MDPLLRSAIEKILRASILDNWQFYALIAAATFVGSVIGGVVTAYAKKRGEALAIKADYDEILRQLRASTKATEDIKTSVQHSDWVNREWKTLRRVKLEELLDAAYSVDHWLEQSRNRWMFRSKEEIGPDPSDKVKRLSSLYFPELKQPTIQLCAVVRLATSWNVSAGQRLLAAGQDIDARQKVIDDILPTWSDQYHPVLNAISGLESEASTLMKVLRDA